MRPGQSAVIPSLWTVSAIPHERENAAATSAWRALATAVRDHIAVAPNFDDAVVCLTGKNLTDGLLRDRLHLSSETTFETKRVTPLKVAYGMLDLSLADHPRPRVLMLLATEATFIPLAEGALMTLGWAAGRARWDIRSAFHVVTRWASDHDPALARLAAEALTVRGAVYEWAPFTRLYAAILKRHEAHLRRRSEYAKELSRHTTRVLLESARDDLPHGHALRELMAVAEHLGILPPRPRFERDEASRRRSELTRLLLDFELDRDVAVEAEPLLDIIQSERERRSKH